MVQCVVCVPYLVFQRKVADSFPHALARVTYLLPQCSAVAAAVLGDALNYELVELLIDERFIALNNRTVDLYL